MGAFLLLPVLVDELAAKAPAKSRDTCLKHVVDGIKSKESASWANWKRAGFAIKAMGD